MEHYQRNGRALQLKGLENARNKVTLGFKCDAGTKIQLAQEANQNGMTLSEYVDTVIATRHQKPQSSETHNTSKLIRQLEEEKRRAKQLETNLNYYEQNPVLLSVLEEHQGQEINFTDPFGQRRKINIKSVGDVFAIIINSFQTQQP